MEFAEDDDFPVSPLRLPSKDGVWIEACGEQDSQFLKAPDVHVNVNVPYSFALPPEEDDGILDPQDAISPEAVIPTIPEPELLTANTRVLAGGEFVQPRGDVEAVCEFDAVPQYWEIAKVCGELEAADAHLAHLEAFSAKAQPVDAKTRARAWRLKKEASVARDAVRMEVQDLRARVRSIAAQSAPARSLRQPPPSSKVFLLGRLRPAESWSSSGAERKDEGLDQEVTNDDMVRLENQVAASWTCEKDIDKFESSFERSLISNWRYRCRVFLDACATGDSDAVLEHLASTLKDAPWQARSVSRGLCVASENGRAEVVRHILAAVEPKVANMTEGKRRDFPLFLAAEKGFLDVVLALLDGGADVNLGLAEGRLTALHGAARAVQVEVAELLLVRGAVASAPVPCEEVPRGVTALDFMLHPSLGSGRAAGLSYRVSAMERLLRSAMEREAQHSETARGGMWSC